MSEARDYSKPLFEADDGVRTSVALNNAIVQKWIEFSNAVRNGTVSSAAAVRQFDIFMIPVAMMSMMTLEVHPGVAEDTLAMLDKLDGLDKL